ncbi:hypothetical protein LIER_41046 [Lithospermum erythrorhizon]|uniref:Uncharacterized protein n=1 Tax=Lithospermum erythrorhizon TaxID=34254 RepID=A0AAV3R6D8_LITER
MCAATLIPKNEQTMLVKRFRFKVLRYFPIKPRLRRLYMLEKAAKDMTWHALNQVPMGLCHTQQIVRLGRILIVHILNLHQSSTMYGWYGLCTDGFDPSGKFSKGDFPSYGMLFLWSTHGRLACPYCMERTKSFRLVHLRKPCWFDCHGQFLTDDHLYRKQKDKFSKWVVDMDYPPPRLSGQQIFDRVCQYPDIKVLNQHGDKKISGFRIEHNWRKKIIFGEISYWVANLI